MMRFAIGIDLGTTNCAVSYVDLKESDGESRVLMIPQRVDLGKVDERTTLASFLYLPNEGDGVSDLVGTIDGWVVGEAARRMSGVNPGRVASSAKSWLGYHGVNLEDRILPWGSKEVVEGERVSPIEASRMLLGYLKECWNARFEAYGEGGEFENQLVTITVPASFDAAAQGATLEAAKRAGFPDTTRLLEEPQAAFYRYLEGAEGEAAFDRGIEDEDFSGERILVVDIGGGTSDFSLFEAKGTGFERVAVSDHILLGGDNIDLALAHAVESELDSGGEELSADQWSHLFSRSRDLKEKCFADTAKEGMLSVAIPSSGSGLFAGSLSAELPQEAIREMLVGGFFPECPRTARPRESEEGLQEWGLPYAQDFAVTRYLADFLRDQGEVDWVLFNGGSLSAAVLRDRLLGQIESWQGGKRPRVLENLETDLSVARGAAAYGAQVYSEKTKVASGARRSVFLEVERGGERKLVCVLSQGAGPDETFRVEVPGLRLRTGRLVQFQAYEGPHGANDGVGCLKDLLDTYRLLPSLETKLDGDEGEVSVEIESRLNEIGTLSVACVSEGDVWPLSFNLRGASAHTVFTSGADDLGVGEEALEKAIALIGSGLGRKGNSFSGLCERLERVLGLDRGEWGLPLIRSLADAALSHRAVIERSDEQAELWLKVSGYLMRPGFGDAGDEGRMDAIWEVLRDLRSGFAKRVVVQELIFWRRVGFGLNGERQRALESWNRSLLETKKGAIAERIRLLGALEGLSVSTREGLVDDFISRACDAAEGEGYAEPYLAALGSLLARRPFYAGLGEVLAPEWVEKAFKRLGSFDWKKDELRAVLNLFLRAARLVERRELNVASGVRRKIVKKLKKAGVTETRLHPLESFVAISQSDLAAAYGEALPAGLVVGLGDRGRSEC